MDLCRPLLGIAGERCRKRGWSRVEVQLGDAATWRPPDGRNLDIVYFSYSLTMIPDWFKAVENALAMLESGGLLGVVDFYFARKHPAEGLPRQSGWTRAFWRWWFGHDDVFPDPHHLPYLVWRTAAVQHAARVVRGDAGGAAASPSGSRVGTRPR